MHSGKREITWFLEGVTKYHRTLSEIINTLIEEKYTICEVVEPIPDEIALKERLDFIDEFHKTTCIIFKVKTFKNNIVEEYC